MNVVNLFVARKSILYSKTIYFEELLFSSNILIQPATESYLFSNHNVLSKEKEQQMKLSEQGYHIMTNQPFRGIVHVYCVVYAVETGGIELVRE